MPIIVTTSDSTVTASTLITRALRLIGQINPGGSATSGELTDGLVALNALIDSWRNDRLMCYAARDESFPLTIGEDQYTIGNGGTFNTTRPVSILSAYVVASGYSYPVKVLTEVEFARIAYKSNTAEWPEYLWYSPGIPLGTITVYQVPSAACYLHLMTETPLEAFESTSDAIYLPPGWQEALAANLAIRLAPEYETEASGSVVQMAVEAKKGIRRTNTRPLKLRPDLPGTGAVGYNIISDV